MNPSPPVTPPRDRPEPPASGREDAPGDPSWGAAAKCFHWGMAALIFIQFPLGWLAALWRLSPTKLDLFVWHKSIGMLVLALAALRLAWRAMTPAPALPAGMPAWERAAARASHGLLYMLMIALPLSGWLLNSAAGVPFRIFWRIALPALVAPDKPLAQLLARVHGGLWIALAALLALHIGAALRHHFVQRDNVLLRMLPARKGMK